MNISLIIVILYIAALFIISAAAKKLTEKGAENYILAGRNLNIPLVAVTITGVAVGGASTIGVSEQAYSVGLAAGWYNVAWAVGAILMGVFAAGKYRSLNVSTVPELFEKFYDTKGRIICVIGQIVIQIAATSLQYVAGGAILASMLPNIFSFRMGMITSAIVFIGITFIGGMWSAGLSNLLNVLLIYVGITLATIRSIADQGGISNIQASLPSNIPYLSPVEGLGWITIISWLVVMITQSMSMQYSVQVSCSAKDKRTAKNGFIIGGLIILPIGFMAALLGISAKAAFPNISATLALPKVIMSLNPVLAGVTLAALWAADVSTACNLLLGSATLFSQDIYKRFINPKVSEKKFMIITKVSVVVLGLLTFILALTIAEILKTLMVALSLATAFTVVFIFTVYCPKLCRKNSAFYTTIAGIMVLLLWQLFPAMRVFPHVAYLEWIVCVATFLITPLIDTEPHYKLNKVLELEQ
ncbi:sodium:solute symporter family protein [Clostridium bovifaecis]|uniref:Sodium:solute symporter family protein n=1 Tax=Clostridium bovifaecis TaxID=2184719 RepID=A0A6I6ELZ4_9CLOT|nr:sodium:solute symporter family protein [Clostridium bovifaecis]